MDFSLASAAIVASQPKKFQENAKMSVDYVTVEASYDRCLEDDRFYDTFYDKFLAKSEEIPPLFATTDFRRQKQMIRMSVRMMVRLGAGEAGTKLAISKLGESHSRRQHNIPAHLYDLWLDALCESIAQHDPDYTPELEQQWRDTMKPGIEMMISMY